MGVIPDRSSDQQSEHQGRAEHGASQQRNPHASVKASAGSKDVWGRVVLVWQQRDQAERNHPCLGRGQAARRQARNRGCQAVRSRVPGQPPPRDHGPPAPAQTARSPLCRCAPLLWWRGESSRAVEAARNGGVDGAMISQSHPARPAGRWCGQPCFGGPLGCLTCQPGQPVAPRPTLLAPSGLPGRRAGPPPLPRCWPASAGKPGHAA